MDIALTTGRFIDRQKLYQIAEYAVAALVLVFGVKYIQQIIAFVLMELYKYLIQRNAMPTAI